MQLFTVALDLGFKRKSWVEYIEAADGPLNSLLLAVAAFLSSLCFLVPERFSDPSEYSSLVLRLTEV